MGYEGFEPPTQVIKSHLLYQKSFTPYASIDFRKYLEIYGEKDDYEECV
jgi:hypothetical protein